MARSRNIKPGYFCNEYLAELTPLARLLFAGLWCLADREGRLEDRPRKIKAETLPYDDCDVDKLLDDLMNATNEQFIVRYKIEGNKYIQIINFNKHQNPHKSEKQSVIPPCTLQAPYNNGTSTVQAPVYNVSNPADSLNLIPDSLNLIPDCCLPESNANANNTVGVESVNWAEKNWGRMLSPGEVREITTSCDELSTRGSPESDLVVIEALKQCDLAGVRNIKYFKAVLTDWRENGVLTVAHVEAREAERKNQKEGRKGKDPGDKPSKKSTGKYDNFYL